MGVLSYLRGLTGWGRTTGAPPGRRFVRSLQARYDAAQTTSDNTRHWVNADDLSAQAANSREVRRILRRRARYECANNPYAQGILRTLANELVGRGATLQIQSDSEDFNTAVEAEWLRWARAVRLWSKLRTARKAKARDGEAFLMLVPDPHVRHAIKWNIVLVEADRVTTPELVIESPTQTDGITFDANGQPLVYHILRQHPGDVGFHFMADYTPIPARFVLHWFEAERPGQLRGVTEFSSQLGLFADLRRYTKATVKKQEVAADIAGFLEQTAGGNPEEDEDQLRGIDPFVELNAEMGMFLALPDGATAKQFETSQPVDTYQGFKREIINEVSRPWCMSLNIAACNSEGYNFSSGRLDHRLFDKNVDVERDDCEDIVLNPLFRFIIDVGQNLGLFDNIGHLLDWTHSWDWPRPVEIDPKAMSDADRSDLEAKIVSLKTIRRRRGLDAEKEQAQILAEMASGASPAAATSAPVTPGTDPTQPVAANATGAFRDISRRQWGRNIKAISDVLDGVTSRTYTETRARVLLRSLGLADEEAGELIADALAEVTVEAAGRSSWLQLLASAVAIEAGGDSQARRRFEMVAYSGGELLLPGWKNAAVIDLSGLDTQDQRRPIILNHDKTPAGIVGASTSIENTGAELLVAGDVMTNLPAGRFVSNTASDGFPWQASVGSLMENGDIEPVPSGASVVVNGQKFTGPIDVVRRGRLREVSFVVLGADSKTSASLAASAAQQGVGKMPTFEEWLVSLGVVDAATLTDEQRAMYQQAYDALGAGATEGGEGTQANATAGATGASTATAAAGAGATTQRTANASAGDQRSLTASAAVDPSQRMRDDTARELERQAEIRELCASAEHMAPADRDRLAADSIRTNLDVRDVRLRIMEAQAPSWATTRGTGGGGSWENTAAILEACACRGAGMSQAALQRNFPARVLEASGSREWRDASLSRIVGEFTNRNGGHIRPGRLSDEAISHAATISRRMIEAAGGFSPLSLPGILGSAANKLLLAGYERPVSVVPEICSEVSATDFKEFSSYRMTGKGKLESVGPDGELRTIQLAEEEYKNKVSTKGAILQMSREMMVNDDLNAFGELVLEMGTMATDALEVAVIALLMSNQGSFFHADNGNLLTGAGSVLSIAGVTDAVEAFDTLKDVNGRPIRVTPDRILVPPKLAKIGGDIFRFDTVNETTTTDKPKPNGNPYTGQFKVVKSPYLSAVFNSVTGQTGSATKWWLMGDPSRAPVIRVAFLQGRNRPTIESADAPFNTAGGMQWRVIFDFGVQWGDKRGAVQSNGA